MVLGPTEPLLVDEFLISREEFVGATFRHMSAEGQRCLAVEESRRIVHISPGPHIVAAFKTESA
jgi:hypothetical protein